PEEQPGNGRERLTGRACGVHESSAIEVIALHLTWAPSHTGVPNASANCRHNSEEQIGLRAAGTERGDAAVSGPEELARVAQPMTERLVRLADVCQMTGQAVDELDAASPARAAAWRFRMVLEPSRGQVAYTPRRE